MINSAINNKKKSIRAEIVTMLNIQKEAERLKRSRVIQKKLFALKEFKEAKNIMFFASFDGEVDTFRMIEEAIKLGKQVVLPAIVKKEKRIIPCKITDLEKELDIGPYGVKQPKLRKTQFVSPEDIDLVVVPGIAFDRAGNRLGRGEGYYDRFLKKLPNGIPIAGLAFSFQILKTIPSVRHIDIPVDKVVFA